MAVSPAAIESLCDPASTDWALDGVLSGSIGTARSSGPSFAEPTVLNHTGAFDRHQPTTPRVTPLNSLTNSTTRPSVLACQTVRRHAAAQVTRATNSARATIAA